MAAPLPNIATPGACRGHSRQRSRSLAGAKGITTALSGTIGGINCETVQYTNAAGNAGQEGRTLDPPLSNAHLGSRGRPGSNLPFAKLGGTRFYGIRAELFVYEVRLIWPMCLLRPFWYLCPLSPPTHRGVRQRFCVILGHFGPILAPTVPGCCWPFWVILSNLMTADQRWRGVWTLN